MAAVGGEPLRPVGAIWLAAAALLTSCGGGARHSASGCGDQSPSHALVYRAPPPASPLRLERTVQVLCERGRGKASVHRAGADEIEVGTEQRPGAPDPRSLAVSHTLAFYDWEPNVLPPRQTQPMLSIFTAVGTASRQRPRATATSTSGDKYYVFGPGHGVGRTLISPSQVGSNQATHYFASRSVARKRTPAGGVVVKVPRGIVVVKDEQRSASLGYWVLRDNAELSAGDITHPAQSFDPQTNEPIVTFGFTAKGRAAFARLTRREAVRGEQVAPSPGSPVESTFQSFAIVLDNRLVSRATVDYRQNPNGIQGKNGAQINGLGNIQETQDLALSLKHPRLPLDLVLARVR